VPRRDTSLRLQDIVEAIDRILQYTASLSLESFKADTRTVDAVVRNLEVIGEAAQHLDADIAAQLPQVPWRELQAMRNLLIHEYFGVSVSIIWETISRDLSPVREAIRQHLSQAPGGQEGEES
jgi:hypothetical protein